MTTNAHTADEASLTWRKSSYSGGEQGQCVEVAETAVPAVHVRDSKVSGGTSLTFAPTSFAAFTRYVSGVDA